MTDFNLDSYKHFRVDFGTYEETHDDAPPTNTMSEILQGSIYLGYTNKFQGVCKLISLRTGRIITRKKFTPLPMPQSIIKPEE